MFHNKILSEEQSNLLPLIRKFKRSFYLVGGTAIALHIGHRRSIDFDLFSKNKINRRILEERIVREKYKFKTLSQTPQEWTLFIGKVKITFYQFFYDINANINFENIIKIPSLLDLAAMKAYTLGERAKWKDYIDLFFIFKYHLSFSDVAERASFLFGDGFNQKLFREQLTFFDDINYDEEVDYIDSEPDRDEIKNFLTNFALQ